MSEVRTEDVSFFGAAGASVSGKLYLPPAGQNHRIGIVMCHGFGGVKEGVLPGLATLLAGAGYTALTFDFRGFGGTGGQVGRQRRQPVGDGGGVRGHVQRAGRDQPASDPAGPR